MMHVYQVMPAKKVKADTKTEQTTAVVVIEPEPNKAVFSPSASKLCFGAHFLDGYVIRRLVELNKICCQHSLMMVGDAYIRFQCKNAEDSAQASYFSDTILAAPRFGVYNFNRPAPDVDLLLIHTNLTEMAQALSDVRKKMPVTISHFEGEKRLRVTRSSTIKNPDYVSILMTDEQPSEPPEVSVPDHTPNITLSVSDFCSNSAKFVGRKVKYVECTMFARKMHWAGYIDETRCVKEHTFENETLEAPPAEDTKPIQKYIFPKRFISVLSKLKQIPAEKSTVRIFHSKDSPLKIQIDVATIGMTNIYLRDTFQHN